MTRRLAHEPLGWRPTVLEVTVRRYRCTGCGHVWRQDTTKAAEPRAKLWRRGLRWALEGIVCQHLTVAPRRRRPRGVVEHRQRRGPCRGQAGPDRRPWALRRRHRDRGRRARLAPHPARRDPLYGARRTLHTGTDLLTDKQNDRLAALFKGDQHVEVEATWGIYQRMITAYREPDRARARELMSRLIESVRHSAPTALTELHKLGRTLKQRAGDVLAYFDRPGTSNGPTEATNGRLEHLRGSALGFRNLTNYIARSLLETGGFRPRLHPGL